MYYVFDSRKKPTFDKQYGRNMLKNSQMVIFENWV